MTTPMNVAVAFGVDRGYVRQLATALRSLTDLAAGTKYEVFVIQTGFETDLRARAEASCDRQASVHWLTVPDDDLGGVELPDRLPPSTAFRLLAAPLLPHDLSRVIYLDADVLVRRSLAELWDVNLGGHPLAAVRDAYLPVAASELPWRQLGIDPRAPYFNAGVMLIDLEQWRARSIGERAVQHLRTRSFSNADQGALNAVAGSDWQHLPPIWNVQSHHLSGDSARAWGFEDRLALEGAIADPGIVHFSHGDFARPWQPRSSHPFREQWFAALDRTPWAGWRPRDHRGGGAIRRVRRAAAALLGRSSQ